ncbi:TPA: acyltransferase family protein [Providencia rettgeri]
MIWTIQYLRFFACFMVVIYHITRKVYLDDSSGYMYFGDVGVDIFFVISGFIMSYISNKKESDFVVFIKNRVIRIYPIYIVTLIPFIAIYILFPHLVNSHGETPSIIKSITLFPFIDGGYINMVAWTLSFEFYFYFIFAISLAVSKKPIEVSSFMIILLLIVGIIFNVDFINSPMILEFVAGMWVYQLLYANKKMLSSWMSVFIIVIGSSLIITPVDGQIIGLGFDRVLHYGIPSVMIFIGFLGLNNIIGDIKSLTFLGNASYSIYLTHIITINAVYFIYKVVSPQREYYLAMIFVASVCSVIVGCFVYRFIETPIINIFKSKNKKYSIA